MHLIKKNPCLPLEVRTALELKIFTKDKQKSSLSKLLFPNCGE